jgi:hypothetical protein
LDYSFFPVKQWLQLPHLCSLRLRSKRIRTRTTFTHFCGYSFRVYVLRVYVFCDYSCPRSLYIIYKHMHWVIEVDSRHAHYIMWYSIHHMYKHTTISSTFA